MSISQEQIESARNADLYSYLLHYHPESVRREGEFIRFLGNHSITIKQNSNLYMDWANYDKKSKSCKTNGEAPNGITFLTEYLNYSFQEAVSALSTAPAPTYTPPAPKMANNGESDADFYIPAKDKSQRNIYAYLCKSRGIEGDIVTTLYKAGLLYQHRDEKGYTYAVFLNRKKNFYEITTTLSDKRYKRSKGIGTFKAWYYYPDQDRQPKKTPSRIFITESAIDSISLYQLRRDNTACYLSTASTSNASKIIDSLLTVAEYRDKIIIATDNDTAGDNVRNHYSELETIRPQRKDWNEDIKERLKQ